MNTRNSQLADYNWMGWTKLHYAIYTNDMYNIQLLLSNPATDVNAIDVRGNTPLHLAAKNGVAVKLLLDAGADVHAVDQQANTPLHNAALFLCGDDPTAGLLLAHGAYVNQVNQLKNTPLHHAAMLKLENKVQVIELLNAGAKTTAKNSIGCSPLMLAKHFDNIYFIQTVKEHTKSLIRVAA